MSSCISSLSFAFIAVPDSIPFLIDHPPPPPPSLSLSSSIPFTSLLMKKAQCTKLT